MQFLQKPNCYKAQMHTEDSAWSSCIQDCVTIFPGDEVRPAIPLCLFSEEKTVWFPGLDKIFVRWLWGCRLTLHGSYLLRDAEMTSFPQIFHATFTVCVNAIIINPLHLQLKKEKPQVTFISNFINFY